MRFSILPAKAGVLLLIPLAVAALASAKPFVHPGVLNNRIDFEFIRDQIKAGAQPWKKAYDQMRSSGSASPAYQPKPRAVVECGSYSNPDNGCTDESNDAVAAYTQALLWVFTGDETYAKNAAAILEAWAKILTAHTNSNAPLQSARGGTDFPRAAEILRYTWSGWTAAMTERQIALYKQAFIPMWLNGSSANGNWELTMIDAMTRTAVFMDDSALFGKAMAMWRARIPAYFYLKSDGPLPVQPPGKAKTQDALIKYWYSPSTFVDGLSQETCRDYGHLTGGIASAFNAAETAMQQGVDLYGEEKTRLTVAMEFHASFLNGKAVPDWLCGGKLNELQANATWEIAYNHYHNRLGLDLPETRKVVEGNRPTGTSYQMAWETMTHAELGARSTAVARQEGAPRRGAGPRLEFTGAGMFRLIRARSPRGIDGKIQALATK
jgi:hypothetical protein